MIAALAHLGGKTLAKLTVEREAGEFVFILENEFPFTRRRVDGVEIVPGRIAVVEGGGDEISAVKTDIDEARENTRDRGQAAHRAACGFDSENMPILGAAGILRKEDIVPFGIQP